MTERFYRFPPNRRAEDASLRQQISYMRGEVDEVMQAHLEDEGDARVIEETMDVIQCAEGILRRYSIWAVLAGCARVKIKCFWRGDYRWL